MLTPIETVEDIAWVRETIVETLPASTRFVILTGHHEGSPDKVEAWNDKMPDYDQPADFTWTPPDRD